MRLYRPEMCLWCWEYDEAEGEEVFSKPATYTITLVKDGATSHENICQDCHDGILPGMLADNKADPWWSSVEVDPYTPLDSSAYYKRGERVEVIYINRAPELGTVVHCYFSYRRCEPMANVVLDGRKWPHVYPARILQRKLPVKAASNEHP